jgi:hypothetical protein
MQPPYASALSAEVEQAFASDNLRHGSRSNTSRMIPRNKPYDTRGRFRLRSQRTEQPWASRSERFPLVTHLQIRSDRLNALGDSSKATDEDWAKRSIWLKTPVKI